MEVRPIRAEECAPLGEITVRAYEALFAPTPIGGYEHELRDVAARAADSVVLVAVDSRGTLLGGVTYVPGSECAMAEFDDPTAAGIRMLAVDPVHQGAGAGRALIEACIARAATGARARVILHSTPEMTTAHALYARLGFARDPGLDVLVAEEPYDDEHPLHLMAFTLTLE